jgi:hypothetical protein
VDVKDERVRTALTRIDEMSDSELRELVRDEPPIVIGAVEGSSLAETSASVRNYDRADYQIEGVPTLWSSELAAAIRRDREELLVAFSCATRIPRHSMAVKQSTCACCRRLRTTPPSLLACPAGEPDAVGSSPCGTCWKPQRALGRMAFWARKRSHTRRRVQFASRTSTIVNCRMSIARLE